MRAEIRSAFVKIALTVPQKLSGTRKRKTVTENIILFGDISGNSFPSIRRLVRAFKIKTKNGPKYYYVAIYDNQNKR